MKRDINEFLSAVAQTPNRWQSVEFVSIAIYAGGGWQNLVSIGHLRSNSPSSVKLQKDLPSLDRFCVLQEVFSFSELPKLIAKIRRGSVLLSGKRVQFTGNRRGNPFEGVYESSASCVACTIEDEAFGPFRMGHRLFMTGETTSELYRTFSRGKEGLEAVLRASGWEGINGLLIHALRDPEALSESHQRRVTFLAPLDIELVKSACTLAGDSLHWEVITGSRTAGTSAFLYITGENLAGKRVWKKISLEQKRLNRTKHGVLKASGEVRIRKPKRLFLTLQVGEYRLDQVELHSGATQPPLPFLAHGALFPRLPDLQTLLLQPTNTEGAEFERAVLRLFGYAGLGADHLGDIPQKQNAPDGLIWFPEGKTLGVIEATVGTLTNKGKLARLVTRTRDLASKLPDDVTVFAIMAVASRRDAIPPSEWETAISDGVRVLTHEDLETLYLMMLRRESPSVIANYLHPEWTEETAFRILRDRNPQLG